MTLSRSIAALLLFLFCLPCHAQSLPDPLGAGLEGFDYPFGVRYLSLSMESQPVKMAYMDVAPAGTSNGRVALLLHGRNFSGFYWERTIRFLSRVGYRVVIPDQIGFGKSSKPDLALSFHQLARNTRMLLDALGIERTIVIAHSMGCMLGARYALMHPRQVERLVLESPIGLEDYRLKVPCATNEELAREAASMSRQDVDRFYRGYFVAWKPEYQIFADIQYRSATGPEADRVNRTAAHTYQLAYEQPVLYELPLIRVRTLIIGGGKDRSAIGRNRVSAEVRETLGRFAELIPAAAQSMPDAEAVVMEEVGHIPHLEAIQYFHSWLQSFLEE
jgi:pimeloyl-ACP methyl ester carboxylesterase